MHALGAATFCVGRAERVGAGRFGCHPEEFHADDFDRNVVDLGLVNGKIFGAPIAVSIHALAMTKRR